MKMEKYHKVTRADYRQWYLNHQEYREQAAGDSARLTYHLMPETGWLNDPNGLCQMDGTYHIYYQYTPFEPTGEIKLWGHYTTRDFIHYEDLGPALFPDHDMDAHGAYSGSAWVEDGTIHYFYTGNIKYFDRPDYDYIRCGRGSNTIHFTSRDGEHFTEKELVMSTEDYPADISCHVRDPKILKEGGFYYMALGARDLDDRGLILLYRSPDLKNWEYYNRITTPEPFGYMWECPDLFWLDGRLCLLCCPQGVVPQGIDYENVHQCVIMTIDYDFEANQYTLHPDKGIPQVDRGFDFYAPQTFADESGRRILIGWMGIPDADYTNPTTANGWQHALTLPRELHMRNGRLYQTPLKELESLRSGERRFTSREHLNAAGENKLVFEAGVTFSACESFKMNLRQGVYLEYEQGILTLAIEEGGFGRTGRSVKLDELKSLQIFSDTTSLEIFVNDGAKVFTTRVYSTRGGLNIEGDCRAEIKVYDLASFSINR